jgi:hypothetical protein
MTTTEWFDGTVKPVRPGVYQTRCGYGKIIGYRRWSGKHWCGWWHSLHAASKDRMPCSPTFQNDPRRGLTTRDGK